MESDLGYVLGRLFGQFVLVPIIFVMVIGGLYYLVSGRRVSFWRAVFRWWGILLAFLLVPLGAVGQAASNLPAWRSR